LSYFLEQPIGLRLLILLVFYNIQIILICLLL